jgi:hypothetical protein
MTRQPLTDGQKRVRTRSIIVSLGATALLAVAGMAMRPLMPLRPLGADDVLCFGAAFILLLMGLVMAYVHVIQPKDAPMPRARLSQVLNFVLGGVALLLPILGERFIDPGVNFAVIMALYVIGTRTMWIVWREADEFMRAMLRDASVAAFHVSALSLAVYASGERLGLLGGATAWGYLGFVSLANIMCSYWAIFRHGADRAPAEE